MWRCSDERPAELIPLTRRASALDFIDALLEGGEKQCPKCGKIKPAGEFYKEIHRTGGRSSWCKECARNDRRNRYYAWKIERIKKEGGNDCHQTLH